MPAKSHTRQIVSAVMQERRNSDLRADDPQVIESIDCRFSCIENDLKNEKLQHLETLFDRNQIIGKHIAVTADNLRLRHALSSIKARLKGCQNFSFSSAANDIVTVQPDEWVLIGNRMCECEKEAREALDRADRADGDRHLRQVQAIAEAKALTDIADLDEEFVYTLTSKSPRLAARVLRERAAGILAAAGVPEPPPFPEVMP